MPRDSTPSVIDFILAKNRHGKLHDIELVCLARYLSFEEPARVGTTTAQQIEPMHEALEQMELDEAEGLSVFEGATAAD